jgi:hypothetical protein
LLLPLQRLLLSPSLAPLSPPLRLLLPFSGQLSPTSAVPQTSVPAAQYLKLKILMAACSQSDSLSVEMSLSSFKSTAPLAKEIGKIAWKTKFSSATSGEREIPTITLHGLESGDDGDSENDPEAFLLDTTTIGLPPAQGRKLILDSPPSPDQVAKIWALGHGDPLVGPLWATAFTDSHHGHGNLAWCSTVISSSWPKPVRRAKSCVPRPRLWQTWPQQQPASPPYESVFVDYIGPLPEYDGFKHIIVFIDRFSHDLIIEPAKSTTAQELTQIFVDRWIAHAGVLRLITSDGGSKASRSSTMCRQRTTPEGAREQLSGQTLTSSKFCVALSPWQQGLGGPCWSRRSLH